MPSISGHELIAVNDTGHTDLTLADEGEVVGVDGDEESFWKKKWWLAVNKTYGLI